MTEFQKQAYYQNRQTVLEKINTYNFYKLAVEENATETTKTTETPTPSFWDNAKSWASDNQGLAYGLGGAALGAGTGVFIEWLRRAFGNSNRQGSYLASGLVGAGLGGLGGYGLNVLGQPVAGASNTEENANAEDTGEPTGSWWDSVWGVARVPGVAIGNFGYNMWENLNRDAEIGNEAELERLRLEKLEVEKRKEQENYLKTMAPYLPPPPESTPGRGYGPGAAP